MDLPDLLAYCCLLQVPHLWPNHLAHHSTVLQNVCTVRIAFYVRTAP